MISAWWLLPAFIIGSWVGIFMMALLAAAGRADEEALRPEVTE